MKPLVQTVAVVTVMAASALVSSHEIFASAPDNAASSTRNFIKTKIVSAQTSVKTSTTKPKSALVFSASTNKKVYKPGEPILVTMRVRNVSRSQQVLNFSSGRSFDIAVSPQNGSEPIWQWSWGRMFAQMMRDVPLAAGESQVFTATWNRSGSDGKIVAPGKYQVAARLTTMGAGVKATPITVTLK